MNLPNIKKRLTPFVTRRNEQITTKISENIPLSCCCCLLPSFLHLLLLLFLSHQSQLCYHFEVFQNLQLWRPHCVPRMIRLRLRATETNIVISRIIIISKPFLGCKNLLRTFFSKSKRQNNVVCLLGCYVINLTENWCGL